MGYILPVTLPDVGSMTVKAFIEDRGANLISPMLFTKFYDVDFSKEVIVFDPNKIRPAIPYAHSSNPDVRPVIRVNVGASWVDLVIDSGADQNGISSVLASICKVNNYPVIHVPLHESLGKTRQATYQVGYQVPVYIPGAFSGIRTFYISNIRKSNLSLLSATLPSL